MKNYLKNSLKVGVTIALATVSMNIFAARLVVGVNTGGYNEEYVGPNYAANTEWIPGHWEEGYWVPAQYIQYAEPAPEASFVWYNGSYNRGYYNRGYNNHGYYNRGYYNRGYGNGYRSNSNAYYGHRYR